jgi:5-methylcytosine-specific restriction endonuclease McrA
MPSTTDPRYGLARWKKLRAAILDRDEATCQYCGGPATTVDHVVAHSKGGDFWDPANLVAACASCNYSKSDRARPGPSRRRNGPAFPKPADWPYPPCQYHGEACGASHSRNW